MSDAGLSLASQSSPTTARYEQAIRVEMLISLRFEALWLAIQQVQRSFIHRTTALKSAPSLWQTTYPSAIFLPLFAHDARLQHLINASAIMPRVSMTCPIRLVKCAAEIVQLSDSVKNIIELLAKWN
jgi:Tfp pilus assembly protein PilV